MKTTDVVLVRPWDYSYEYIEWQEDIQIGYLSSFLNSQGLRCFIVDLAVTQTRSKDRLEDNWSYILDLNPTIVAFVMDKHPTNNPFYTIELVKCFRNRVNISDFNPHLSIYGHTQIGTERLLLELPIDSVVTGEEADFLSLTKTLIADCDLSKATGIAYKSIDKIHYNPPVPLCSNLDSLPQPHRYLIEFNNNQNINRRYVATIQSSRGCYSKCNFCFLRAKEKLHGCYPWRGRSIKSIIDEMQFLYHTYNIREFSFVDSQFIGPGSQGQVRAQELAKQMMSNGLVDIAFNIYSRSDSIFPETIAILKEAGLYAVFVGVESFSQSMLDRLNKGQSVADNMRAIEVLKHYNVHIRMGFISFDHLTTFDEIYENISKLKSICSDKAFLITQPLFFQNILAPLENTPYGNEYIKNKIDEEYLKNKFSFPVIEQQLRYSCNGTISDLDKNPGILLAAEAIRILGSEILLRSSYLELKMAHLIENEPKTIFIDHNPLDLDNLITWYNDLTPFTVDLFEKAIEVVADNFGGITQKIDEVNTLVKDACDQYDNDHLGMSMANILPTDTRMCLVG